MADNELIFDLLERCDILTDEIGKIKRAIQATIDGKPFNEAFNEDLYLESVKSDAKRVIGYLENFIVHLYKLKYGRFQESFSKLRKELREYQSKIIRWTTWNSKPDKNIVGLVVEQLDGTYKRALKGFRELVKENPDEYLIDLPFINIYLLSDTCLWDLEELIDTDLDELLKSLPNPEENNEGG